MLASVATVSQTAAQRTVVGRLLGPPVTAMAIAFLLGSVGVLPSGGSAASSFLADLSLKLATPALLLSADLSRLRDCGPLLASFGMAAAGTVGSCCATMLAATTTTMGASSSWSWCLRDDAVKIAAALMAKNVGGGINYMAVCRTLGASPAAVAAGLCVDNVFALVYFPLTSALAKGLPDPTTSSSAEEKDKDDVDVEAERQVPGDTIVKDVTTVLALASVSTWFGEVVGGPFSASLPCSTLFALAVAFALGSSSSRHRHDDGDAFSFDRLRVAGDAIGTSLLYLFFATAGAPGLAVAADARALFVPLTIFLSALYAGHGAWLAATRWWCLRRRRRRRGGASPEEEEEEGAVAPQRLLVASSAAIGGPATAAALARANGWDSLLGPSLLVGNLGYAIATFLGVAFYGVFRPR